MDGKTKEALKQLQAEIRQLQTAISAIKPGAGLDGVNLDGDSFSPADAGGSDAAVQYTVRFAEAGEDTPKSNGYAVSQAQLSRVTDEAVASIGYALSSPQKVGLLRSLLGKASESASTLGEATGLSTGSLYHHLRDLMHADLITQAARNRYVLTNRGLRVLLVMSALAA